MNAGFDYVYDTVSCRFLPTARCGSSEVVPRRRSLEAARAASTRFPDRTVRRCWWRRSSTYGGPNGGGIAIIDLQGRLIAEVPNTPGCFPGGFVDATTIVIACPAADGASWQTLRLQVDGSGRQMIAPDDPPG